MYEHKKIATRSLLQNGNLMNVMVWFYIFANISVINNLREVSPVSIILTVC